MANPIVYRISSNSQHTDKHRLAWASILLLLHHHKSQAIDTTSLPKHKFNNNNNSIMDLPMLLLLPLLVRPLPINTSLTLLEEPLLKCTYLPSSNNPPINIKFALLPIFNLTLLLHSKNPLQSSTRTATTTLASRQLQSSKATRITTTTTHTKPPNQSQAYSSHLLNNNTHTNSTRHLWQLESTKETIIIR